MLGAATYRYRVTYARHLNGPGSRRIRGRDASVSKLAERASTPAVNGS
jgi:hypothetical protein